MAAGLESKKALKEQAKQEFQKDVLDLSIMAEELESRSNFVNSEISKNIKFFTQFYQSLDEDQVRKISDQIKRKIEGYPCFPEQS